MDREAWRATVHGVTESDMTDVTLHHTHNSNEYVYKSSENLVEMQVLIQKAWGGVGDSAFLAGSQLMLRLLVYRPGFEGNPRYS